MALGKDTDAGVLDMPGEYVTAKKPIRMGTPHRFAAMHVANGDSIQFTLRDKRGSFGFWRRQETIPPVSFNRAMSIDTMIPIEVIDEFGLDVGIGVICGQSKK